MKNKFCRIVLFLLSILAIFCGEQQYTPTDNINVKSIDSLDSSLPSNRMFDFSVGCPSTWDMEKRIDYSQECASILGGVFGIEFKRYLSKQLGGGNNCIDSTTVPMIDSLFKHIIVSGTTRTAFHAPLSPMDTGFTATTHYQFEELLFFEVLHKSSGEGGVNLFRNTQEEPNLSFNNHQVDTPIETTSYVGEFLTGGKIALHDITFNGKRYRNAAVLLASIRHKEFEECAFEYTLIGIPHLVEDGKQQK